MPAPDVAERLLDLIDGVENLDTEARLHARELVRASFSKITLWHAGNPPAERIADLEFTARGGGALKLRIARDSGAKVSG